jgi:hypothetical protein
MRIFIATALLALTACGPTETPPPLAPQSDASRVWFICDGVDAPSLFVFERDGDAIRMSEYDKPNGAIVTREDYTLGEPEGAAGSIYTSLLLSGAEVGAIRETNPSMLETPAAAYTPRITELRLGERTITYRWLPRTRLFGVTGRRSFVVHEDADGDLIYTSFDFAAAAAPAIELSENGVSTPFSAEVRGGEEMVRPDGAEFRFQTRDGFAYAILARSDGTGGLGVTRDGDPVQAEEIIAFQIADGPAQ